MTTVFRNPKNWFDRSPAVERRRAAICFTPLCFTFCAVLATSAVRAADAEGGGLSDTASQTVDVRVRAAATSAKVLRYAQRFVATHDANKDGRLQQSEWSTVKGEPALADVDGDAVITADEFALHVARFATPRHIRLLFPESPQNEDVPLLQPKSAPVEDAAQTSDVQPASSPAGNSAQASDVAAAETGEPAEAAAEPAKPTPRRRDAKFFVPASRLPAGLPSWFHTQDKDGDGQITMAEYTESLNSGTLAEFNRLDRNGDGLITAAECVQRSGGGSEKAQKERLAASLAYRM